MTDRVFVDTNILVYAIEANGPDRDKTSVAREVLRDPGVCLSTQVLGEFYRAVTSARRASPLGHDEAVAWVQLWKRHEIRPVTVATVDLALGGSQPLAHDTTTP
jgi:predicted nucleic acid-binding protein